MRVTIIGAGYVGLTTAVGLAWLGHSVTCVEKDAEKLEQLVRGEVPIRERYLPEALRQVRDRITFVPAVGGHVAEVAMIAVGTPSGEGGVADTRYVEEAARELADALADGGTYTVVVKSTVPIGTNRRVAQVVNDTLQRRGVTAAVQFASNPEFLREGTALRDMLYPERIVVGTESKFAADTLKRLYAPVLNQSFQPVPGLNPPIETYPEWILTDTVTAEMIKYAANAFLALKVSFINEVAGLCERVGADIEDVARGIGSDSRIGRRFLSAGIGWGGSCLPKDTSAILATAAEHDYTMPIIAAAREVNERQRQRVVDLFDSHLEGLAGRTIGILGVAFKPNTDDVRKSPALDIAERLLARGAQVRIHDPLALSNARRVLTEPGVAFADDPYELAEGCDGLLLATEWDEYRNLRLSRLAQAMRTPLLIDGRNLFDAAEATAAGLVYVGVGRGRVGYPHAIESAVVGSTPDKE